VAVTASLRQRVEALRQPIPAPAATNSVNADDLVVKVRRGPHIVDDTLARMGSWTVPRWRQGVVVHFEGEQGIDCGALTREWAKILSQQLLRAGRGLFRRTPKGNRVVLLPDQESEMAHGESTEGMYVFVGRFIAYALLRSIRIDAVLTPFLFRLIIDPTATATFDDLKEVDPSLHANLSLMRNCPPDEVYDTFCQCFCMDTEFLGVRRTVELEPGGAAVPVTGDNVDRFTLLYAQYVLKDLSARAINAFLHGFYDLVPRGRLAGFSPAEFEAVLCGQPAISDEDVEELREASHCSLDATGRPHRQVLWFWEVMRGLSADLRSMVVQFVTGNERPPLTGFAALEHPFTVQVGEHLTPASLPEAHVCFNQLVLAPYASREVLRDKLLLAVREGREGFEMV